MNDEKQAINVYGGINNIAPNATKADQLFNAPTGQQPAVQPLSASVVPSEAGTYRHFITHDAVGVPLLIDKARRHIVFHAAFYPKYAEDNQGVRVWEAMTLNPRLHLTAIFTDISQVPWADEFARSLRTFFDAEMFQKKIDSSKLFFHRCLKEFGATRVHLYDTSRLPMFPVILIDDTLIVGHYAHSSVIPPEGLWLTIRHPRIPAMYESLLAGLRPDSTTAEERAIVRYLEELMLNG